MPATYKLTLNAHVGGGINRPLQNVFGYHDQLALPADPTTLGALFIAQVIPALLDVVSDGTNFDNVLVEQVIGGSFFNITPFAGGIVGHRTGEQLPYFNAWGFQYLRAALGQHSGAKRFAIVCEADQNGGNPTAAILPALGVLADSLQAAIKVGIIDTWFPVILERPKFVGDTWHQHGISDVLFKRITSQNTRKR